MNPITDQAKWFKLQSAFDTVFISPDAFGHMFHHNVQAKTVIFPIHGLHLTERQFSAVVQAATTIGDDRFYLSEIEIANSFSEVYDQERVVHWEASIASVTYEDYTNTLLVLENAIYSAQGNWGVMVSAEDHAVVGGTEEFMRAFKRFFPAWQQEMAHFQSYWRDAIKRKQQDSRWFDEFVEHING